MPIQRKYDFKPGTKISSDQVDEEFNQLISQINQVEDDDNSKDADVRSKAQMTKITSDTGSMKLSANKTTDDILNEILNAGVGLHTFYAVTGSINLPPNGISIRGVAQLTAANFGWVWCIDYQNQMWTNYLNNNIWSGWRQLATHDQNILWSGALYPMAGQTITPSKKLSECAKGWILVWSDYTVGSGANDYRWHTNVVPKTFASFDNGGGMLFHVPTSLGTGDGTGTFASKYFYINDATLTGHTINDTNDNRFMVLRKVIEF